MDRVGPGDLGRGDDARDVEVAVAAGGPPDADVVIGEPDVQRLTVGFGKHRDRFDPELFARADDPQGDLPAVRNEDFLEHQGVSSSPPAIEPVPSLSPAASMPDTLRANSLGLVA